ncbi:hypothetical protein [Hymenobacter metallicola]|uniref:Uncharacterized protein n=1 Tax=Hymenobacter metallicola TaxID=2563114 RepID=A0A4Z0QFL6_9BACT|nr:hypothetical protein [Hymenobacter metallicola]TGE28544.1 hypothetical protein E5K02_03510 [Hymenobacter metallicola]
MKISLPILYQLFFLFLFSGCSKENEPAPNAVEIYIEGDELDNVGAIVSALSWDSTQTQGFPVEHAYLFENITESTYSETKSFKLITNEQLIVDIEFRKGLPEPGTYLFASLRIGGVERRRIRVDEFTKTYPGNELCVLIIQSCKNDKNKKAPAQVGAFLFLSVWICVDWSICLVW